MFRIGFLVLRKISEEGVHQL